MDSGEVGLVVAQRGWLHEWGHTLSGSFEDLGASASGSAALFSFSVSIPDSLPWVSMEGGTISTRWLRRRVRVSPSSPRPAPAPSHPPAHPPTRTPTRTEHRHRRVVRPRASGLGQGGQRPGLSPPPPRKVEPAGVPSREWFGPSPGLRRPKSP